MNRANFPDGHDIYQEDLVYIQDTAESELNKRMEHMTSGKGIAEGLTVTTQADQVTIASGQAYDNTRYRLIKTANTVLAVGVGDINKYIVIERATSNANQEAHPVTGALSYRRLVEGSTISLQAAPTAAQVKIAKITNAVALSPPTIDTTGSNREGLALKAGRPYKVVASDGSGDYTTISAALTALSATGGKIYIKTGVYDLGTTLNVNFSNIAIEGSGPGTRIRTSGTTVGCFHIAGGGVGTEISNISLSNLMVEYSSLFPVTAGTPMTVPLIDVTYAFGVLMSNVTFKNSIYLSPYQTFGLQVLTGCKNVMVQRCYFNGGIGSGAGGLASFIANMLNQAFTDCVRIDSTQTIVSNCQIYGFSGYGIYTGFGADRSVLANNTLVGHYQTSAIGIQHASSVGSSVTDNSVSNCRVGIKVFSGAKGVVCGNVVSGCTGNGIELTPASTKNVVAGNTVVDNGISGILDVGTGNVIGDNVT